MDLVTGRRSMTSVWVIRFSVLLASLLIVMIVWQGLVSPMTSMAKNELEVKQDRVRISTDSGSLLTIPGGDASMYVPCCIFGAGGEVSMIMREPNLFQEITGLPGGWTRPKIVNVEYYDPTGQLVEGAKSSTPLNICFSLSDDLWQMYQNNPKHFQVQFYDDRSFPNAWKSLNTMPNDETRQLCGQVNSLALFALAVWGNPIPVTGSGGVYNP